MKFIILLSVLCIAVSSYKIDDYQKIIMARDDNPVYKKDFDDNIEKLLKIEPHYFDYTPFRSPDFTFDCKQQELTTVVSKPTSVHRLRPSDINVVAALGDSLTAALGANAKTVLGLLFEYRGRSWSMGGDDKLEDLVTLPNVLKKFNANLKGFSTGKDFALLNKEGVAFNAAVSGEEANHIPAQVRRLIQRLKESKDVDFENDWKLVTLFIGGNDICSYCKDKNLHSAQQYINDIQAGLDILYNELPRTFVNLVSVLDAGQVKNLNQGLVCSLLHKFVCKCAAYPESPAYEQELEELFVQYTNFTDSLGASGRYDGREDFTVVVQPFFQNFTLQYLPSGEIDLSYFAPDCFHLSTKGHGNYLFLF